VVVRLLVVLCFWSTDDLWFVIVSEAKDLLLAARKQILRFAQDDKPE
jgi:hypothetical protein